FDETNPPIPSPTQSSALSTQYYLSHPRNNPLRHSDFVIDSNFGFRISSFRRALHAGAPRLQQRQRLFPRRRDRRPQTCDQRHPQNNRHPNCHHIPRHIDRRRIPHHLLPQSPPIKAQLNPAHHPQPTSHQPQQNRLRQNQSH